MLKGSFFKCLEFYSTLGRLLYSQIIIIYSAILLEMRLHLEIWSIAHILLLCGLF